MLAGAEFWKTRGCSECRGADFAKNDDKRKAWNCEGDQPGEHIGFKWDVTLRQCPMSFVGEDGWQILDDWRLWKDHGLCPGGEDNLMQCPAYVTDAILIADSEAKSIEAAQIERQQKEQEKAQRQAQRQLKRTR